MANGNLDLQAAADWVSGHHRQDGLVGVVRFIQHHNDREIGAAG